MTQHFTSTVSQFVDSSLRWTTIFIFTSLSILTIIPSCSTADKQFKEKVISYLQKDIEETIPLVDYYKSYSELATLSTDRKDGENDLRFILQKTDRLLNAIQSEINDNNNSETINKLLTDSMITTYAHKKQDYSIVDFGDSEINKLQKELEFLRIKKEIYLSLYSRMMGCKTFDAPSIITISDSNKVNIIYGILDTFSRPDKLFINTVTLNDKKVNVPATIDCSNGYCKIVFHSDKSGIYKWTGGYTILEYYGRKDTLPISGQFAIK